MKTVSTEQISSQKKIKKDIKETIVMSTSSTNSANKNSRVKKNTKTRLSIITLFVLLAVFSTAVFSVTTSASSLDKFFENNLPAPLASGLSSISHTGYQAFSSMRAAVITEPKVSTDKADYAPGETAIITGSGFASGETVRLQITHSDGTAEGGGGHEPFTTVADADGNFSSSWHVNTDDSLGSTFELKATGETSGLIAVTTFTDGNVKVYAEPGGTSITTTATVNIIKYGSTNCTGTALTGGNNSAKLDQPISNTSSQSDGVAGSVGSIRFTASATGTTNTVSKVFLQWRSLKGDDGFTYINENGTRSDTTSRSICFADGNASTGTHTFYANYGTKLPTATTLTVSSATGQFGGSVNLTAKSSAGGVNVSNQTVNFFINGKSVGGTVTDPNGVATITNVALTDANNTNIPVGTYANYIRAESVDNVDFYGASGTNTLTITAPAATAPSITTQPAGATKCPGDSVTFSVVASGTSPSYQWYKGSPTIATNAISGATLSSYTISPVAAANAGDYYVKVSNSAGTATSNPAATLTVNTPPSITGQPQGASKLVGEQVTFSVTATGTALTYQWRKGGVNLTNGGAISGATTSTLAINPVSASDASSYDVVVSGTCTPSVTSSAAALSVNKKMPVISWSNPSDITYGTTLSGTQLNAAASYNNTAVEGTYVYSPASGVLLSAGTQQTLSVTFTPTDKNTYDTPQAKTVQINVKKAAVTATAGGGTATYDGSEKTPSACVVSGAFTGGLACTNSPAKVGPTAGTTEINPVVSGDQSNFEVTLVKGSAVISQAQASATATNGGGAYKGSAYTGSGECSNGLTPVISYPNGSSAPVNVGSTSFTVTCGDGDKNFINGTANGSIVITKAAVTATAGSGTATYDGSEKTPSDCVVSGDYTVGLACTNSPAKVGPNAGTTEINPVVSGDQTNFAVTLAKGSAVISQAQATAKAIDGGGAYKGSAYTGSGTCSNGLTPAITYTPGPDAPVSFGTTSFTVTCGDGNKNFINGAATGSIVITKAAVTATAGSGTATYDGTAKSPSACVVSGALPGAFTGDLSCANDITSVGPGVSSTTIKPVVSGTGLTNFDITSVNGTAVIDQAGSSVTVTCSGTFTFTGLAQTPCTATATGAGMTALNVSSTLSYSSNTNAGQATASASYAGDDNHTGSTGSKTFTIGKAPSTTTVTCSNVIYNTTAQTPCAAVATGVGGLNQVVPVIYSNNTSVGTATASASYGGDSNHLGSNNSTNFTIAARPALVRYIGQTQWTTSGSSATTAQVTLSASVQDPTQLPIIGAKADFIDEISGKTLASGVNVSPVAGTGTGTVNTIVTLSTGQFGAEYYHILVKLSVGYTNEDQDPADKTAGIFVTKPAATNESTGAGTFKAQQAAGTYAGSADGISGFSVGMAYNKSFTNLQGKITLTVPQADGSTVYIKSNSISSMVVTPFSGGKKSTIYTKSSVTKILANGTSVAGEGGVSLRMDITDNTTGTDQVGFTVLSSSNSQLFYSNNWALDSATNAWRTVVQNILSGSVTVN